MARKKCGTCKYRCRLSENTCCQFILVTGHMRGCDPEDCIRYISGKRINLPKKDSNFADFQRKEYEKWEERMRKKHEQSDNDRAANEGSGYPVYTGREPDSDSKVFVSSRQKMEARG